MISTSFLNSHSFLKIVDICSKITSSSSPYAFTFSKSTNWSIDYIPPSVTPNVTTPVDLFAYLRVFNASPVIQTPSSTNSDFSFNNVFYKKLDPSFSVVSSYNCSTICFESTLVHNQLNQASWRGLGLAISSSPITTNNIITSNFSLLSHIYLQYSGPRTKENNVTEYLRLVLPILNSL